MKRQETPTSRQSSGRRNRGSANSGFPIAVSILCALILLAIVGWVFWTHSNAPGRQDIFTAESQGTSHPHSDQRKPSAGKASTTQQASPTQAAPSTQSPVATLQSPAIPPVSPLEAKPTLIAGHDLHAERKGLRNGCKSGTLSLHPDALTFLCPGDAAKSVSVTLAEIMGPNDDGFETSRHEKYHFKVDGMSKDDTRLLFSEWFSAAQSSNHP